MFAHKIIIKIFFFLLLIESAYAVSYYSGNINIEQIILNGVLENSESAQINVKYVISNIDNKSIQAEIYFPGFSDDTIYNITSDKGNTLRYNFQPGKTIFSVSFNQKFDSNQKLTVSPVYRIDGKLPVKKVPVQHYFFEIKNNRIIIISSEPLLEASANQIYSALIGNSYVKNLRIEVGDKNIRVYANRSIGAYGQVGDIVNITTTITNIGDGELEGLSIEDSVFASYFEPISEEFSYYEAEQITEPLYIYSKNIPSLSPSESYSLDYAVKVVRMGSLDFTGARIMYKGEFLTSTEAGSPIILPIHINQQIKNISSEKVNTNASVKREIIQPSNDTDIFNSEASIFRPEEKNIFYQKVEDEENKNFLFNLIAIIILLIILGLGYLTWIKYKEIIIETFSSFKKGDNKKIEDK
jgi:hypothetical protein